MDHSPLPRSWCTTLAAAGGWIYARLMTHEVLSNVTMFCSCLAGLLSCVLTLQTILRNRRRDRELRRPPRRE
jgi:hypothetical protein